MSEFNSRHALKSTPPPRTILPVLKIIKDAYLLWVNYHKTVPKTHRYTLAARIDTLFIEVIEAIAVASFLQRDTKLPWIRQAIRKLDTLKILLMVLWEARSLDNKKYIALSEKLDESGRMLGGWFGQINKQNSPAKAGEK